MNYKILKLIALLLILAGSYSCKDNDTTNRVTGTVIGSSSDNSFITLLIQVDEKYPIGETIEYVKTTGYCTNLPNDGVYLNMIQVQPLSKSVMGNKISFTYRPFKFGDDDALINTGNPYHSDCSLGTIPIYVITDYKILK